jgi:outer membrane protein assembly factor BamB
LEKGEKSIKGEDKLKRLKEKTNRIRLDAGIFKTLWENQILIPEKWKEQTNGNTTFIFFDGTVLRNSIGNRFVLCLCWDDGEWLWYYDWLENDWYANVPSAVLASSTLVSETSVS